MLAAAAQDARLRITEVFYSLQGETTLVGFPTVFIRLTGCPLRCQYCDSAYAFQGGQYWTVAQLLTEVQGYAAHYVTVSGGEPLAQPGCLPLLTRLCDAGYTVSLETSGALSIAEVDARVLKILDIKTPGSNEQSRNLLSNLTHLTAQDQLKFVICDRADFDWAVQFIQQHALSDREILFSPSFNQLQAAELADWLLTERPPGRLQIQLHKYLWGDGPGR